MFYTSSSYHRYKTYKEANDLFTVGPDTTAK